MTQADSLGYRLPLFDRRVYAGRRRAAVGAIRAAGLDLMVVTVPENIYYLVGLDHFGYFAFHMLLMPARGEPVLVARSMEHVTIGRDLPDIRFEGYGDHDDLPRHCRDVAASAAPGGRRVGMEESSLYLIPTVASAIRGQFDYVVDAGDLITAQRLVQSPEELDVTRRSAAISDAMIDAAVATAAIGITEREIAAACVESMMEMGGEPPAFWPFLRSTSRFNEDHTTWTDYALRPGDALFVELSGSVGRYHAPMGRVIFVGELPEGTQFVSAVCLEAFEAARLAAGPGVEAGRVYQEWQSVLDSAGLSDYRRHHCGYATGIGFPPSWSGGGVPRALRPQSRWLLEEGMVFHLMSWMMETGVGDYFVSDPVVISPGGAERLSATPQSITVV